MRSRIHNLRRLCLASSALAALLCISVLCHADEPIRWKFTVGEKLAHHLTQDTSLVLDMGSNGQRNMTVQQVMDIAWDVQGVNNAGEAVIEINFDRVRMKVTGGPMAADFDSAQDAPATGMAVAFGPAYKALTKTPSEVTMTARGEIKDVKVPQEVLDALKNSPGAAQMGDLATPEGFQKFFLQGLFTLPEKAPEKGEHWSTTVTNNNAVIGKQTTETTYTFDRTKQVDGDTIAVFHPAMTVQFDGTPQMQMKVKDQKSDGEVLFNEQKGRLESMSVKHDVTMEVTVANQTRQQQINQNIQVTMAPKVPEAKSAADDVSPK